MLCFFRNFFLFFFSVINLYIPTHVLVVRRWRISPPFGIQTPAYVRSLGGSFVGDCFVCPPRLPVGCNEPPSNSLSPLLAFGLYYSVEIVSSLLHNNVHTLTVPMYATPFASDQDGACMHCVKLVCLSTRLRGTRNSFFLFIETK